MNITPENALEVQHQAWLQHPVTQQLIKNMENHRMHVYNKMGLSAFDKVVSDSEVRYQAVVAQTNKTLTFMITNTNEFVGQSKK